MVKRNFLKLLIVFVLSVVVFEQTYIPMAQADMGTYVSNALSGSVSSVTTGQGGFYHAQGEDIYTLGYTRIRFNLTPGNTSLFTIQPPQFSMGCSGIDGMWGGFSMISGAELEQILQNIISIAIPFAFNMALGVLCKSCEAIMNQIEAIANKLNGLNFNSCKTAQVAAGALSGFMQSEIQTGSSNDWQSDMNNLLSPSGTPSTGSSNNSSGITNALTSFENAIPSGSCSQQQVTKTYTQTDATIQNIYNTISDCGQEKVKRLFHLGSLLRTIADHTNLGFTEDKTLGPTTGGANDMLGILRGSLIGDVYGYIPGHISGKAMVKYGMTSVSSMATSQQIESAEKVLLQGGYLTNKTISTTAYQVKYGSVTGSDLTKSLFYTSKRVCFPGFSNIYVAYFQGAYNYITNSSTTTIAYPFGTPSCTPSPITITSPTQFAQFVSATQVPAIEVLKLAYAENEPGLVTEASTIAGQTALLQWIKPVINGVNLNIFAEQNFVKETGKTSAKVFLGLLKAYQIRLTTIYKDLDHKTKKQNAEMLNLLKTLKSTNHSWIRQLSSQGLLGNYNFSKHLQ